MEKQRLLIISNNVLSTTKNNGKTILSYFDCIPKEQVYQLYFSSEKPTIEGYSYYQLSDKDVIKGWLNPTKRGTPHSRGEKLEIKTYNQADAVNPTSFATPTVRLLRELLWFGHWRSKKLLAWLDEVKPTTIFFVGGDCAFAYNICQFIAKRYQARLSLYITDDYMVSYPEDNLIIKVRKRLIRKKVKRCLKSADSFFTVSQPMQAEYKKMFGKESHLAVNMSESLKSEVDYEENERLTLMYAGSLYYGRADVLAKISEAIESYNATTDGKKAILNIYTNTAPDEATKMMLEKNGAAKCCGSLNQEELKVALNKADILVFAESFDENQIRKTRFSLSTKVPEYLSVGKPILAVGPKGIGSMDYLGECAQCVFNPDDIDSVVEDFLVNKTKQEFVSKNAQLKYEMHHKKAMVQSQMMYHVFDEDF